MQIDNNGVTSNTKSSTKQKPLEVNKDLTLKDDSTSNSKDSVEISNEAQSLKLLEEKIISSPDIDNTRVNDIRQSIAEGKYKINAESIAAGMMQIDIRT